MSYIHRDFYDILKINPVMSKKSEEHYWNIILDYCAKHKLIGNRNYQISDTECLGDSIRINSTLEKILNIKKPLNFYLNESKYGIHGYNKTIVIRKDHDGNLYTYIKLHLNKSPWPFNTRNMCDNMYDVMYECKLKHLISDKKTILEYDLLVKQYWAKKELEKQEFERKKRDEEMRLEYEFLLLFEEIKKNKMNSLEKFKQYKEMSEITSPKQMIDYMSKIPPLCPPPLCPILEPPLLP